MEKSELHKDNFIQANSPDGGFLQSTVWRKFQESFGRKTFNISGENCWANVIEHKLPIVGKYFYIPRGPVFCHPELDPGSDKKLDSGSETGITKIMELARKNSAGWIRVEPSDRETLASIRKNIKLKIRKAPHDMQPKEIFVVDITKPEEQLLSEMKPKTRYNIKVALKSNVKTTTCAKQQITCDRSIDEFVRLMRITAERDKITLHPEDYYRKMFEAIPEENSKLYLAEFKGKIIAANIVVFYGKVATYLHGATDNEHRNVMAPYLLQWQAIADAKRSGYEKYDFGGVRTEAGSNNWAGITRFKMGFSATAETIKFPGSYDIVISPLVYNLYRVIQRIKALF